MNTDGSNSQAVNFDENRGMGLDWNRRVVLVKCYQKKYDLIKADRIGSKQTAGCSGQIHKLCNCTGFILCFGGGVLVSTIFIHMLSEVEHHHHLQHLCLSMSSSSTSCSSCSSSRMIMIGDIPIFDHPPAQRGETSAPLPPQNRKHNTKNQTHKTQHIKTQRIKTQESPTHQYPCWWAPQ